MRGNPQSPGGPPEIDLDNLAASPDLVKYYRQRFATEEKEKDRYLLRIEELAVGRAKLTDLEISVRARERDIEALRTERAGLSAQLAAERRRVVSVTHDNEELALVLQAERKKMGHVLSVTNPQMQQLSHETGETKKLGGKETTKVAEYTTHVGGAGQRSVRVVYLASGEADMLRERVKSLEARLSQETETHVRLEDSLKATLAAREDESKQTAAYTGDSFEKFEQRAQNAERQRDEALSELLSFRYEARETERLLREKVVSLTACNEELSRQLQSETARLKASAARSVSAIESKVAARVDIHRQEEMRARAGMKAAVQKAEQAEVASEEHVRQLREKVVKLARQQDAAMRSAAVQREAIKSEAAELKQKLRVMEGVVSQLTSAEAQELRQQSVSLKPQVNALMRKAKTLP
jgi:hypothetical protein